MLEVLENLGFLVLLELLEILVPLTSKMQTLVLCLMVAVSLSTLLKLSLATLRVRWSTFVLCALFVGLAWPWAV